MKNRNDASSGKTGISFVGLLTIAFIVLKLCEVISWSWLLVLSPIWINVIVIYIVYICSEWIKEIRRRKK